jgi:hypothetical protein
MRRKQQTTSSDHHCPARNSCGHFQREPRKQHTETKKKKEWRKQNEGKQARFYRGLLHEKLEQSGETKCNAGKRTLFFHACWRRTVFPCSTSERSSAQRRVTYTFTKPRNEVDLTRRASLRW